MYTWKNANTYFQLFVLLYADYTRLFHIILWNMETLR